TYTIRGRGSGGGARPPSPKASRFATVFRPSRRITEHRHHRLFGNRGQAYPKGRSATCGKLGLDECCARDDAEGMRHSSSCLALIYGGNTACVLLPIERRQWSHAVRPLAVGTGLTTQSYARMV